MCFPRRFGIVFIRNELPSMCTGLFPHYCVLWGRTKLWGIWILKQIISTQLGRGRYRSIVVTQKRGSCIPWNPTLPREAHGNVFIRNDLPSICRGLFSHYCVLWGRTKLWGIWISKRTISTQLGQGHYRWYQSHTLAESVGLTCEDACACKGGGL